ncbi:MAG: GIY-YIG nuclease family protein [Methanomassiliicoccus sp.]|nr:GIY-YIG nuclease family protein [Methanomassiliicoccus sp.]
MKSVPGRPEGWKRTPGAYIILFSLPPLDDLSIGRLGTFDLPTGRYAYVGSAMNGLEARTARHLRGTGKRRWHIDVLMAIAKEKEAVLLPSALDIECSVAGFLRGIPGVSEPVRGFGSSDCRCRSHLFHLDDGAAATLRADVLSKFLPDERDIRVLSRTRDW